MGREVRKWRGMKEKRWEEAGRKRGHVRKKKRIRRREIKGRKILRDSRLMWFFFVILIYCSNIS